MINFIPRRAGRALVVAAAVSTLAAGASVALTGTARADSALTPDPVAYCIMNPPFGPQVQADGFKVFYDQLLGDSYQNDWRCGYLVAAAVPTALGAPGKSQSFTLPPVSYSTAIDWNAMCNQQFPGSWATWIPGPATGAVGAPWECLAPAGVTYDPAENAHGIHAVISRLPSGHTKARATVGWAAASGPAGQQRSGCLLLLRSAIRD